MGRRIVVKVQIDEAVTLKALLRSARRRCVARVYKIRREYIRPRELPGRKNLSTRSPNLALYRCSLSTLRLNDAQRNPRRSAALMSTQHVIEAHLQQGDFSLSLACASD